LYLRSGAAPAPPPSKTTIWRVLTDADTEAFDVAVGTWLMNLGDRIRDESGCVLRYQRTFMRPLLPRQSQKGGTT